MRRGFTMVELLVVILIIVLVSAVVLPQVLPAINHRQVTEAGRIFQAGLVQARSSAVGKNAPRGIRLLEDPTYRLRDPNTSILAFNRWVPIEPGPDYSNGLVTVWPVPDNYSLIFTTNSAPPYPILNPDNSQTVYPYFPPNVPSQNPPYVSSTNPSFGQCLMVEEAPFMGNDISPGPNSGPANPTSWFWNIRVGDRMQLGDAGGYYTVVGPMTVNNPELFVNDGPPGTRSTLSRTYSDRNNNFITGYPEFLFLVNGIDDNGDGWIDSGFDGMDWGRDVPRCPPDVIPPNPPPITVGIDGRVDNVLEWETETWQASLSRFNTAVRDPFYSNGPFMTPGNPAIQQPMPYVITRRPVVSPGATETTLPTNVVIDATSWNSTRERSRLPIDSNSRSVDILLNPTGTAVLTTLYSSPSSVREPAYMQFWLAERPDVHEISDVWGFDNSNPPQPNQNPNAPTPNNLFRLPIPAAFTTGLNQPPKLFLTGERLLVTLFSRTGQVTTNAVEVFDAADVNTPFYDSQLGAREAK
jgi:prepilin-type N-terminal cleavage/methylation domain-containing protein